MKGWLRVDVASGALAKRVAQTFGTRIVLLVISLVGGVVVARGLGAAGRGEYATASVIASIGAQFAGLGVHASNTYHLAKDRGLLPTLLANSVAVSLLAGGFVGILVGVLSLWLPSVFQASGTLLLLAAFAVPLYCAFTLLQNLFLALHETGRFNRTELALSGATLAAVGTVLLVGITTPEAVYAVSLLVALLVIGYTVRTLSLIAGKVVRPSPQLFVSHFRFSSTAYISGMLTLLLSRVDLLLVSHLRDAEAAGHYVVAIGIGDLLAMLPVITGNLLFPTLSGESDPGKRWFLARRSAIAVGLVTAVAGGLSAPLAAPLMGLLYGNDFLAAVPAYYWLLPGVVFLSVNVILMNYFAAEGMPPIMYLSPLAALALKIFLCFLLIPDRGIQGAGLAATAGYGAMLLVSIAYLSLTRRRICARAAHESTERNG